jgi:hypothetical protein
MFYSNFMLNKMYIPMIWEQNNIYMTTFILFIYL